MSPGRLGEIPPMEADMPGLPGIGQARTSTPPVPEPSERERIAALERTVNTLATRVQQLESAVEHLEQTKVSLVQYKP